MKHKKILLFAILALVLTCTGCGQRTQKNTSLPVLSASVGNPASNEQGKNGISGSASSIQPGNTDNQTNADEPSGAAADENPSNADRLFEISNLRGTVTEFSEIGCKLSPTIDIGDNVSTQAAPGYEDTFVSVVYNPDCTFQIAHSNIQTTTVTYEPAAVQDVKKQTNLILCGEYDNNDVLHASRVFIYRMDGV